jgi:pSer/pThr/pTyr-binding forkhead associated (FHA) protein
MVGKPDSATKKKLASSLIVNDDSPDFGVYPLTERETIVGRSPDTDIQLSHDPTISRQHFKVIKEDGKYRLVDMKSANGTFVNGAKISEVNLQDKDQIQAGQTKLLFRTGSQGPAR